MRGRTVWIIAICLMGLLALVASCSSAPTAAPTNAVPGGAPSATAPAVASPAASAPEKPQYGGTLTIFNPNDPVWFDQDKAHIYMAPVQNPTNDKLLQGDWAKGPAGTGQYTHIYGANVGFDSKIGALAQSYQILSPGHMVFHIRQGVHFALNPNSAASKLVNGREMTADDIVYSIKQYLKENVYVQASAPHMVANTVVTAPDKWTVDIKSAPEDVLWVFSYVVNVTNIIAPEVVAKYGDLSDWKNSIGTGPFMLTDYVSGSHITYQKNPNYWDKDPVGPGKGNQLPYIDTLRILILPDPSTQQTAMRTGKIDEMAPLSFTKDNYDNLMKTTPKLQSKRYIANGNSLIFMRTDKQNLPFHNVKVRQALTMAIDYKSIVNKLLLGDAEYPGFPTLSIPDFKSVYFPLSQAPQDVQDMYTYNPTKAKQMLADAGYPNGFSTNIIADSTGSIAVDQLSLIKEYWSKIGVDLTIKPLDFNTYTKLTASKDYDQMMYAGSGSHAIYIRMINWVGGTQFNGSLINDPKAKDAASKMALDMAAGDQAKADATYVDFEKYAMEQQWSIPFPAQYDYNVWWPWLKNYHGELNVGFDNGPYWAKWVWIDQHLKKSMMGQ